MPSSDRTSTPSMAAMASSEPYSGRRFLTGLFLSPLLVAVLVLMAVVNGWWHFWLAAAGCTLSIVWAWIEVRRSAALVRQGQRCTITRNLRTMLPTLLLIVCFLAPWFHQPVEETGAPIAPTPTPGASNTP